MKKNRRVNPLQLSRETIRNLNLVVGGDPADDPVGSGGSCVRGESVCVPCTSDLFTKPAV